MLQRRRAYTLPELALTLLVILITAAVTYPVLLILLSNPNGKNRRNVCLSNQKQLAVALMMYVQDYDERFPQASPRSAIDGRPPFRSATFRAVAHQDWAEPLFPYVKNTEVFRCSKDESPAAKPSSPTWAEMEAAAQRGEYPISYTLNAWIGYGVELGQVNNAGDWVVIAERNNEIQPPSDGPVFFPWMWAAPDRQPVWPAPRDAAQVQAEAARDLALTRHSEGSNYVFADGHAKYRKFTEVWRNESFFPALVTPTHSGTMGETTVRKPHAP